VAALRKPLADRRLGHAGDVSAQDLGRQRVPTPHRGKILPPENATGNYVTVVQRVPVKILVDELPPEPYVLGPGMSVVPTIKLR